MVYDTHWTRIHECGRSVDFWLTDWRRTFGDGDEYVSTYFGREMTTTRREAGEYLAIPVRLFLKN